VKKIYNLVLFLLIFVILSGQTYALTIKLGSLAPTGSPWDKKLKQLALEWKKISNGKVRITIYPGGIAGDESAMIRKIRLRQLQAAAITTVGMNQIAKGSLAMSAPLLIKTDDELNYILEKATPVFEEELEKNQFVTIMWTFAGWTHFFGKKPIFSPDDVRKQKLWVWDVSQAMIQVYKKAGFTPIPLAATDILTSLQSGMIDSLLGTALTSAAYQWFAIANNMCDLNFAPMIAGIVVSKSVWAKIPDKIKPELLETSRALAKVISEETRKADAEAIEIMKQYGLNVCEVDDNNIREWQEVVDTYFGDVVESDFGLDAYKMVKAQLEEYRKNAEK